MEGLSAIAYLGKRADWDHPVTAEGATTMSLWTILFIILLIAWITGFGVFHVAGGLIHLLLLFAVVSLILHFVMGRRVA
jgi:Family of unknown function (DUF5670)